MNKIVDFFNNRYLIAIVVALFVISVVRSFAGRKA